MNAQEIRKSYLSFFEKRQHVLIKRAPLILKDDPSTLFTGSGMQPMIPYLLGETHPKGSRLVDSQTCLRAQDIEDIGDNRHTTFFEMLGNWSLGDYFKEQQIKWIFQWLSEEVGLDMSRLYVTCFIGAPEYGISKDIEAAEVWKSLFEENGIKAAEAEIGSETDGYNRGVKEGERIFYYDGSKNWWSRNGGPDTTPVGDPCGPDSEMFYDFGIPHNEKYGKYCHPNCDCGRFMEIGNNVFMAYQKLSEGKFELLEKPNIDHGSGLERIAAASKGDPDVFKISLLWPIIEKIQAISGKDYESNTTSMRVIADHLRAATFLAVDGCLPSNKEQGYVMRRLIRRAVRFAFELGVEQNFLQEIVPIVASLYVNDFPEIESQINDVIGVLVKEEKAFRQTLRKGLLKLKAIGDESTVIDGNQLFTLYDTYGFPVELSTEEIFTNGYKLAENWRKQFDEEMTKQRDRSRTATKGEFKGGLGGDSLMHKKYHTATHLLQSALRQIFGQKLRQHGSNITEERLRFDFNLDHKMTTEEISQAEELVNGWINDGLDVSYKIYPTKEALDMGAIGPFGERYNDSVKVYTMGNSQKIVSLEICGGPHVENTAELKEGGKRFKITKEESSSSGIRRIKAELI